MPSSAILWVEWVRADEWLEMVGNNGEWMSANWWMDGNYGEWMSVNWWMDGNDGE